MPAQTTQEAAERLAAFGFAVLPLHTIEDGTCSCGSQTCHSPGKHPIASLVPNGVTNATSDAVTIRQWFALWPDANIGIATGAVSGVTVVDVDPDKGGEITWWNIQKANEQIEPTWYVSTGGGGSHYYFQYVPDMRNLVGVLPGIDIRNDAAYVVAPPSLHASGDTYVWANRPDKSREKLAAMPTWLEELLGHKPGKKEGMSTLPEIISDGQRNQWLTSAAGSMRRKGFSLEAMKLAIHYENSHRCKPPLEAEEVDRICWSINRYPAETVPTITIGGVRV